MARKLTEFQKTILDNYIAGVPTSKIAENAGCSRSFIYQQLRTIYRKLGITGRRNEKLYYLKQMGYPVQTDKIKQYAEPVHVIGGQNKKINQNRDKLKT